MDNKIKLAIAGSASLLALGIISAGAYAYFTDVKETANTFTVGDVDIALTETAFDSKAYTALVPNQEIKKNPVVTNTGNTSAFIKVDVLIPYSENGYSIISNGNDETTHELFKYTVNSGWEQYGIEEIVSGEDDNQNQYLKKEYVYQDALPPGQSAPAVFNSVFLQNIADGQEVCGESFELPIVAHAIQAKGLTVETAFAEYEHQTSETV